VRKYIIMGVQGSGKGTQAKLLARDFDLVHISVGDIFRWHVQSHTKVGARIRRLMNAGELVPDEVVEDVVKVRLDLHDWNFGFILDGFPRNGRQAGFFLESYDIDAVIHIRVVDQVVLDRILNRRLCSKCGLDYNLIGHRPATCAAAGWWPAPTTRPRPSGPASPTTTPRPSRSSSCSAARSWSSPPTVPCPPTRSRSRSASSSACDRRATACRRPGKGLPSARTGIALAPVIAGTLIAPFSPEARDGSGPDPSAATAGGFP
jgi:adenylate kinase family enzyme